MRDSDTKAIIDLARHFRFERMVRTVVLSTVAGDSYDEAIERIEEVIAALPPELPKGRDRESRTIRNVGTGVRELLEQGLRDVRQLRELDDNTTKGAT